MLRDRLFFKKIRPDKGKSNGLQRRYLRERMGCGKKVRKERIRKNMSSKRQGRQGILWPLTRKN